MAPKKAKKSKQDELGRKDYIGLDDETIESLKRHYKIPDLNDAELLRYLKVSRLIFPED